MNSNFYLVIRVYISNGSEAHSVEMKATLREAQKRFYNIVAADLANDSITYHAAYILDSTGMMVDSKVFDRRAEE